jgi:hypothetical protein
MSRTWFFPSRKPRVAARETTVGRWLAQESGLPAERLRIFGFEATDGRHVRISL